MGGLAGPPSLAGRLGATVPMMMPPPCRAACRVVAGAKPDYAAGGGVQDNVKPRYIVDNHNPVHGTLGGIGNQFQTVYRSAPRSRKRAFDCVRGGNRLRMNRSLRVADGKKSHRKNTR